MIPSNRWFPSSLSDRAAWFENFALNLPTVAADLGVTTGEVTMVQNDAAVMKALPLIIEQIDTYKESIRKYRIAITENPPGSTHSAFPEPPAITAPPIIPNGIFKRISDMRDRIMLSENYTDIIGATLGILSDNPAPPELKPVIKVTAQFSGYKFDVVTSKQGMQAFKVLIRRMDSEAWQEAAFGTTSPLVVTVAPHTPGQAERIQVCVQLIDKNQPVGIPSAVEYVTINP